MNQGLVMARVVKIRPESHSVDVLVMADNRRIAGVHVLAPTAATDFGFNDLTEPEKTGYEADNSYKRDIYCIVSWVNNVPVVLGFLYPQVSQMLFKGPDHEGRAIYRHGSDLYWTVDKKANAELHHPSGWFFRLSTDPDHEDLTAKDYDKRWKLERNAAPVKLRIANKTGTFRLTVSEDGAIEINANGVTINSDVTINGDLEVSGKVNGASDVTTGSISLKTHKHGSSPLPS